jgi:hypothetical protein
MKTVQGLLFALLFAAAIFVPLAVCGWLWWRNFEAQRTRAWQREREGEAERFQQRQKERQTRYRRYLRLYREKKLLP